MADDDQKYTSEEGFDRAQWLKDNFEASQKAAIDDRPDQPPAETEEEYYHRIQHVPGLYGRVDQQGQAPNIPQTQSFRASQESAGLRAEGVDPASVAPHVSPQPESPGVASPNQGQAAPPVAVNPVDNPQPNAPVNDVAQSAPGVQATSTAPSSTAATVPGVPPSPIEASEVINDIKNAKDKEQVEALTSADDRPEVQAAKQERLAELDSNA